MHILLIASERILPTNSGGRMRTWNFIEALSSDYNLSLLYKENKNTPKKQYEQLSKIFSNIWMVPLENSQDDKEKAHSSSPSLLVRAKNFMQRIPWEIKDCYDPCFERYLLKILDEHTFDAIFIRYLYNGQYIFRNQKKIKIPTIIDLDDLPAIYLKRQLAHQDHDGLYDHFRKQLNLSFWDHYPKKLKNIRSCFVSSECDRQYVIKNKWTKNVTIIPNSIDIEAYDEVGDFNESVNGQKMILFCGTLNYGPNTAAMEWFVTEILPLIKKEEPLVKVTCIGSGDRAKIKKMKSDPTVSYHFDVPSVIPYYQKCSIFVVPLLVGGGTRIKILEAFSCRRPVVSTTIGAEGLGIIDGQHCLIADKPDQFAQHCIALLRNPEKAQGLTLKGYQFVQSRYRGDHIRKKILKTFNDNLQKYPKDH